METGQKEELLAQATAIARTIDFTLAESLSFTSRDENTPGFQGLTAQMTAYCAQVAGLRAVYTLTQRGEGFAFGPRSQLENGRQAFPPGMVCRYPPAELGEVFRTGVATATRPYQNEHGAVVSGFAPVYDLRTGLVRFVIGVDMAAGEWQAKVSGASTPHDGLILSLLLLILCGQIVLGWRQQLPLDRQWQWRHLAIVWCAVAGLTLTSGIVWRVNEDTRRASQESFSNLARSQAAGVIGSLRELDLQLDGLGRFIESHDPIDRAAFHAYAERLSRYGIAQAWEWIPAVPAQAVTPLETQARQDGLADFSVHPKDAQGRLMAPGSREVYYPVLYAEPQTGNERAFGFDLGSDPVRRTGLLEAEQTGLHIATDPVKLVQETGSQLGLLVYCPVKGTPEQHSRGFALLVLRLKSALQQALLQSGNEQLGISVSLFQLASNQPPRFLAGTLPETNPPPKLAKQIHPVGAEDNAYLPLFLFGKSYLLQVHAEPAYLAAHALRPGWIAGAFGLLITLLLTGYAALFTAWRTRLEREVQTRTRQLQHLNDVHQAIGNIGHLIHTEKDPHALLQKACAVLVQSRGYVTVWMGRPEPDSKLVTMIAHAGAAAGLQAHAPITWDDTPQGRGPTGTAIRERRPVVVDDARTDPSLAPWREMVVSAGAASLAAVPVLHGGRLFGSLTVKADRVGAFNAAEVELLTSLAADLALALASLEEEQHRRAAELALQESETRFRTLIEKAPAAISITRNEKRVYANQKFVEMFGYQNVEELIGQPVIGQWAPEAQTMIQEYSRQRLLGQAVPESYEMMAQRKDGTRFPVQVATAVIHLPDGLATIGYLTDITDRKRAETELRLINRLYALLSRVNESVTRSRSD